MNRKNSIFSVLALVGALMISACNSTDDELSFEADQQNLSGMAVKGFSLRPDAAVLNNLDSVFFPSTLTRPAFLMPTHSHTEPTSARWVSNYPTMSANR